MTRAFSIVALALLASCATHAPVNQPSEDHIRALLPGTWHIISDGGYTEKTFHADGTADGYLVTRFPGLLGSKLPFRSRWALEGADILIYDMRSPAPGFQNTPDEVHRDRILSISAERIDYRVFDGQRITYLRGPLGF